MKTIGCIRAYLGSIEYYVAKMTAGQLVDSVGFATEMPEWENMSADEKIQRTLDTNRVISDIVPYFIEDPDKFFGSLIVDIYQGFDKLEFESVGSVITNLPAAYKQPLNDIGFLTFPGNERLIALDGQHRLLALRIAIKGISGLPAGAKKNASWDSLKPHPELAGEELSVIFVKHDSNLKIRKIFNKVNRYAKQTSRSDNIITADDDIFAVITRRLISDNEPLAAINDIDLVNPKNNTIPDRSKNLTTLSTLHNVAETLLKDKKYSDKVLPSESEVEEAYKLVASFWKDSLENIVAFREYIKLTKENQTISGLRSKNILLKPVTQMALAHAARFVQSKGISWTKIIPKVNKIDWSYDNELWFNILIIPSANKKMMTGKEAIRGAGMVISYLILGDKMSKDEIDYVRQTIGNAKNDENVTLPDVIS